jgi:uncharacterized protein
MREDHSVYHEGELAVQELAGERELAARHGGGVATSIMPGAWSFLSRQELLVLAAEGDGGEVWISIWFGARGFAESRDEGRLLYVDRERMAPLEVDPLEGLLREGGAVGLLAIELETRKRLRVNGRVRRFDDGRLEVDVREALPNCPKYITQRHLAPPGEIASAPSTVAHGAELDALRVATIQRSDTLFVGSLHPERGADASHRGGDPGFVQVVDAHTLLIPDYAGNGMYLTLGNLHSTPRAGLVFLDFDGRRLLHVTGSTQLHFAEPQQYLTETPALVTGGTGRSWSLHVERWVEGALPASIGAELLERSRFNPKA